MSSATSSRSCPSSPRSSDEWRAALAAQALLARGEGDAAFLKEKIATTRFFADYFLSQAGGLRDAIVEGAPSVLALAEE